jgi:hypothetical protein
MPAARSPQRFVAVRPWLQLDRFVMLRLAPAFFTASLLALPLSHPHAAETPPPQSIEVTAEARIEVAADLALLDFGVVTQGESAAAASAENAKRMDAVLAAVRKVTGKDARISTGNYAIRPLYAQQREPGSPRITGYEASNVLHLRTGVLARVSEIIDAAVKAGANQVQRLAFTLADDEAAQREALRSAVVKARGDAQAIGAALGVKLGAVQSVVEQDVGIVRPLARQAFAAPESGPATPIEPGQVEIRARVVLRTEIAP